MNVGIWQILIVLFWLGDGAAQKHSALPGTVPCRTASWPNHNKSLWMLKKLVNLTIIFQERQASTEVHHLVDILHVGCQQSNIMFYLTITANITNRRPL